MVTNNPDSAARLYKFMMKVLFELLLGLEIHSSNIKKTLPRPDDSVMIGDNPAYIKRYKDMYPPKRYTTRQPPLGQGLAALAVTEEQKKDTLHTHAIAMTTLKPEVLQTAAGHQYLQSLVFHTIDSIYKTEIPATLHIKYSALHELGQLPKERMSRKLPPLVEKKTDMHQVLKFANDVVLTTAGIHAHKKPGACVPKMKSSGGQELCRFGKSTRLVEGTQVIQLAPPDDPTSNDVHIVNVSSPEPDIFIKSRETIHPNSTNRGLLPVDGRPIMYVTSRPELKFTPLQSDQECALNYYDDLLTEEYLPQWKECMINQIQSSNKSTLDLKELDINAIKALTLYEAMQIRNVIVYRNGMVVDFNPVSSAVLRCNTAMYMLGSTGQCIAVFMYLVKYISKDANDLSDSLAMIAKAKEYIRNYPTTRREGETQNMRDLKKFCQRILNNSEGGTREMASTTIAYANIGGKGHETSESFVYDHAFDITRQAIRIFTQR